MTTSTRPPVRALAAVISVVTAGVLPAFLTGALSVQVRRELHFGEAGLGLAVGAFFLAAALSSAALGRVSEWLGPTGSMRMSAGLSAVALVAIAAGAHSFRVLLAFLAVGGIANAMTQPAANLFIARTIAPTRLGLAFALKQAGVPAATLLGGLAVPAFALTVGWRWAFVAGAALAVTGAVAVPSTGPRPTRAPDRGSAGRSLLVLALGIGLGAAAAGTLGAFLVNAAVDAGIAEGPAGLLVAAGSAFGICVRLVAGHLADRRGRGHLRVVALMLAAGSAGYLLYATAAPVLIVAATPLAFGAGWGWPGLFNLAVVRENPHAPGAASGITQTGTYLGAVAGPLVFGWLVEHASYRAAWILAAACSLLGAAAIAGGRAMVRRERVTAGAGPPADQMLPAPAPPV